MSYLGHKRQLDDFDDDNAGTPSQSNHGRTFFKFGRAGTVRVWKRDGFLCCYPHPPHYNDDFVTAVQKDKHITGKQWQRDQMHFTFFWDKADIALGHIQEAGFELRCFDGSVDIEEVLNSSTCQQASKPTPQPASGSAAEPQLHTPEKNEQRVNARPSAFAIALAGFQKVTSDTLQHVSGQAELGGLVACFVAELEAYMNPETRAIKSEPVTGVIMGVKPESVTAEPEIEAMHSTDATAVEAGFQSDQEISPIATPIPSHQPKTESPTQPSAITTEHLQALL